MGYDDLKVIEAKKFLVAVTGGEQRNSTIDEALADAAVITAAAASAVDGQWQKVPQVAGRHLRSRPGRGRRRPMSEPDLPVVVGLGVVDPDLVSPVLGGRCRFVADPTEPTWREAQGAIVRADAGGRQRLPRPHPAAAGGRPHRGRRRTGRPGRRHRPRHRRRGHPRQPAPTPSPRVPSRWPCTWSSGSAG